MGIAGVHNSSHLSQPLAGNICLSEYKGGRASPAEKRDSIARRVVSESRIIKKLRPRREMVLGADEVAAVMTHQQLQHVQVRHRGMIAFATDKLKRRVSQRSGSREVARDHGL